MSAYGKRRARVESGEIAFADIPHGESGYANYGCGCDTCVSAGSRRNRQASERRRNGAPPAVRYWTPEEDAVIVSGHGSGLTHQQVADLLSDRTRWAVACRARLLRRDGRMEQS